MDLDVFLISIYEDISIFGTTKSAIEKIQPQKIFYFTDTYKKLNLAHITSCPILIQSDQFPRPVVKSPNSF